ncbi:MAG: hypothetical protein HYR74_07840 [Candidatus Eisenbacteria bacterium]|nr:hypothetical protein [Candidatus Eisenbacteria bacterium]
MIARGAVTIAALAAIAMIAAPGAPPARAGATGGDAPDSTLHRFLDSLADSTDAYFGLSAERADTTGLDSTLAVRLMRPWDPGRHGRHVGVAPRYAFDRVDGSTPGAKIELSDRRSRVSVSADAAYAVEAKRWLGGGETSITRRRRGTFVRLAALGGRRTAVMDPDRDDGLLGVMRAFVSGSDRQQYLRRDGFTVRAELERAGWFANLAFVDRVDAPLAVASRWNLYGRPLLAPGNLAAAHGRTRGFTLDLGARVPKLPLRAGLAVAIADRALGSDFDDRRVRLSLGGELPVARHVSLLPQIRYGRLDGDPIPQASFYLGGAQTLRSLPDASLGGTRLAIARLDAIGADDVLALAHIPHPAFLPLQLGAFLGVGAVWGRDPFAPPGTGTADLRGWPDRGAWRSEAGFSILYRPGLPEPDMVLRVDHAWATGPGGGAGRWSVGFSRPLDLLPAL